MANSSTTFDTLTDVGKEQRLLFLYDSAEATITPIAYATAASLSFSADTIDVSNKTDGEWTTVMQGKKSAEVSIDALVSHKDELANETVLQAALKAGNNLRFLYAYYTISEESDGLTTYLVLDRAKPMYYGQMQISSLELTSDNGDVCKFSCSGTSQGTTKSAVCMEIANDVEVEQTSIIVKQGQDSTLVYDEKNQEFYLQVGIKFYNNWTGYACCAKSDVYDDDDNIRTDVAFVDAENEEVFAWDADTSGLVRI